MGALLLSGTLFEPVYKFFSVQTDIELIYKMSYIDTLCIIGLALYSLFHSLPYGKFSKSWTGPTVNAKFAWMIQEVPAWVIPLSLIHQSPCIFMNNTPNLLVILLFILHYIQRTLVFPLRIKERAKPVPIMMVVIVFLILSFNGLFQSHHLLNIEKIGDSYFFIPGTVILVWFDIVIKLIKNHDTHLNRNSWLVTMTYTYELFSNYRGVILFILGMGINIHHDGILISLKQIKGLDNNKSEYKIPHGGLFEYVSSANYLGEILEWWGFAVASGRVPQLIFTIFATVFLGFRASQNHHYYKKTFGSSYPQKRTAIIPFII